MVHLNYAALSEDPTVWAKVGKGGWLCKLASLMAKTIPFGSPTLMESKESLTSYRAILLAIGFQHKTLDNIKAII